jgi:TetR/AcrR family transcriptional regulator, mexCD-oprJ operon repressor
VAGIATPTVDHRRATAKRNVEAILDAAERLLERRVRPSIVAVARESGLSRVTVYAHFSTKDQLLEAVVARSVRAATASIQAAEPERGPPLEALERVVSASWREVARHEAIRQATAEELSPDAVRRTHEHAAAVLSRLIERGREEGAFRGDLPAQWLQVSFFALLHAAADEVRTRRIGANAAAAAVTTTITELFAPTERSGSDTRRARGAGEGAR